MFMYVYVRVYICMYTFNLKYLHPVSITRFPVYLNGLAIFLPGYDFNGLAI